MYPQSEMNSRKGRQREVPIHESIAAGSEAAVAEAAGPQEGRRPRRGLEVAGAPPVHAAAGRQHGPHVARRPPVRPVSCRPLRHLSRAVPRLKVAATDPILSERRGGLHVEEDAGVELRRARGPPHRRPRPLPQQHLRLLSSPLLSPSLGGQEAAVRRR
ncbi:hypothetical protein MUK42_16069 [Musa troglodytarum]|uniref:Uncharacterized protein n=1 Tax=Musa troglodytarum TaxID=320322 RepID=A0A9E7I8S7_9LILI|nr:hypothetical protein MUK42_16069 [Musa troglodytarum]